MCFSWKTHENIGGSLNSVQYNSAIWIFMGIPNVAFVNKCFWKKGTSGTGFYCLLSWLLGSRRTEDAHRGVVRQQPRVFQALPSTEQEGRARMVRGAHPLTMLIIRQKHGNRVKSGIHKVQPVRAARHRAGWRYVSEMIAAKNRTWEHVWGRATCSKVLKERTTNAIKQMLLSITMDMALNEQVLAFLMALPAICYSLPS